jgi:hypothetical protein
MNNNKHINTTLEDVSRNNPFTVPENYFEKFSVRIADTISQIEEKKAKGYSLAWIRPRYAVIVLSSLALIFTCGIFFFNNSPLKKLSVNEVKHNIEFGILNETDENELIGQLVVAENTSSVPVDSLEKTHYINSSRIIDDYLSKEDIDLNTIEDAL